MEKISDQGRLAPWMGFTLFGILMAAFLVFFTPLQLKYGIPGLVITELGFAAIAVIFCLIRRVNIREVFPVKKISARDFFGCIFLAAGGFMISLILVAVTATVFPWSSQEAEELSDMIYRTMSYPMIVLIVALLPAVCEEAIHRGAILSNFRSLKHDWVIVLIMAVFFGINHVSVLRFLSTAFLGAILSYVVVKKNNILLSMMMHFMNNLVSVTIGYLSIRVLGASVENVDISSALGVYALLGFMSPVFIVIGMMLINRESHKKIRFLYAGILSAILLISGIGMIIVNGTGNTILNSTIGYEVTEESMEDSTLGFDIVEETEAVVVVVLTNAEGDYNIRIDGDTGSNIINAPVPQGAIRMISYNVTFRPDHYTITVVPQENAIGEKPNLQFTIK